MIVAPGNEGIMQLANSDGSIRLVNTPAIPTSSSEPISTWKFHLELSPSYLQAAGAPIKRDFTMRLPNKQTVLLLETPLQETSGTPKKSLLIFANARPTTPGDKFDDAPFPK